MEQIVDEQNVEKAWRKVKANKGAPGPDGITLDEFMQSFRDEWPKIRQQLLDGSYVPQPGVFASVERYLTRKLKLVVNHAKSSVRKTDELESRSACCATVILRDVIAGRTLFVAGCPWTDSWIASQIGCRLSSFNKPQESICLRYQVLQSATSCEYFLSKRPVIGSRCAIRHQRVFLR
jgi:hypothetical protein